MRFELTNQTGTNWNKWPSLENRSLSNLIEVMTDERWVRLVDPAGKSPEAQKQELAETMLEAHKALCKAARENIARFKNVLRELEAAIRPLLPSSQTAGSAATEATSLPSASRTAVNASASTTSLLSSM